MEEQFLKALDGSKGKFASLDIRTCPPLSGDLSGRVPNVWLASEAKPALSVPKRRRRGPGTEEVAVGFALEPAGSVSEHDLRVDL